MFDGNIVALQAGDNTCRVKITVVENDYTEDNVGHLTAHATWTGGRRGSGNATFSEILTNPNGNLPALCLFFNENSLGWTTPTAYWGCGFNQAGGNLTESNKSYVNWEATTISGSTPPFLISPIWASMAGWDLSLANQDFECEIVIEADFPIFLCPYNISLSEGFGIGFIHDQSDTTAETYANQVMSGDYSNLDKAVNFNTGINEIPHNEVWSIQNYLKINGTLTTSKAYAFRIKPDAKIYLVLHDKGLNGDGSANFILHITESPWEQKSYHAPDSAYTETSILDSEYWNGYWTDYNNGTEYVGYGSTNIPIFDSDEKGQAYAQGLIGIEDAINSGDTTITSSTIGEGLEETEIPSIDLAVSGVGCNIYALSKTQIKTLMADCLYQTDPTIIDNLKDALWTWGNNPIDFFIDCYYVPFDITDFYSTDTAAVKFGTYVFTNYVYPIVLETAGTRKTLFNTTFEGVYGDWRDYTQFEYDLFLPFIGFVKLDVIKYLNKKVRCEMMFDLTTHNLRYYLFCDNIITDRFDGSVGINIPLMASDMVNKAKNDRQAGYDYIGSAVQLASAPLAIAGGQNPITSAVNGVIGAKQALEKANERARESVNGGFSSSMNVYDITMAYLRIREKQIIKPSTLNATYNYPSFYIGALSSLSGYCEIADIQLKSNCTESEYNEIINLLKGGVIF